MIEWNPLFFFQLFYRIILLINFFCLISIIWKQCILFDKPKKVLLQHFLMQNYDTYQIDFGHQRNNWW